MPTTHRTTNRDGGAPSRTIAGLGPSGRATGRPNARASRARSAGEHRNVLDRVRLRLAGIDGERGDVPGWVLVTLMTAGLVVALWAVAGPMLTDAFTQAIQGVSGP
ncbi:hypothetical protein GCM10025865_01790 [Paraoerskovia sediminicola]|uniref:Uncharacterized protein n=1 Tax=Paraoerskovia sediminicola TaxID=1138587 RepID=A0ABM8FYN3_9CELL|nr:hypothetical protein [Paraoerskovia sediminicola]BDZ40880.1 hypothetical protein GCM10025865_01790 [Paraoerskovia sediminicola]